MVAGKSRSPIFDSGHASIATHRLRRSSGLWGNVVLVSEFLWILTSSVINIDIAVLHGTESDSAATFLFVSMYHGADDEKLNDFESMTK
jgi:hypothetical protein